MTTLEAIDLRTSRRSYLKTLLSAEHLKLLQIEIDKFNRLSGLSIQLIQNGSETFQGIRKSYGMFSGVQSFFALVGSTKDENLNEKAGYYGELLVLEATRLGLGTCWVSGSFDRKHCPCKLKENEALVCVITVGNVENSKTFKEKMINRMTHAKGQPSLEKFYTSESKVPDWFLTGIKAVHKAPSAANRQPVRFNYQSDQVTAFINDKISYEFIDLGIAKSHFELAAGGRFEFGNNAVFHQE